MRTFSTGSTPTDLAVGAGGIWIGNGVRQVGCAPGERVPIRAGVGRPRRDDPPAPGKRRGSPLGLQTACTAHRGDGCRCLGGQSRSERLPDRSADEPGRGGRCRRPGLEHRCGGERGVDRPTKGRSRDRSTDEPRLEADPGRRRQPDRARRRRRRGLGRRSLRRQRLADRPRPGAHTSTIPLGVGVDGVAFGEGAVWATNEIADEVYRIDPDTTKLGSSAGSRPARSRGRRGRRLGHVGGAALGRGGPPGFLLQQALLRRSGQPAFRRRVRSPAAGPGPSGHPAHDGGDPLRPRAARLQGRALHRRLPVMRRLDGPGRGIRPLQVLLEREGLCPQPRRHRRHRDVQLGLLRRPDPDRERGSRRCVGHDQPVEHVDRAHTPLGPGEPEDGTRLASGTSSASRPPTTCRPWPAPSSSRSWARSGCLSSRMLLRSRRRNGGAEPRARDCRLKRVELEARNFDRLARRIARTRADAVFIGGFLSPNGGALVRDLRARLGPDVALVAPDRFSAPSRTCSRPPGRRHEGCTSSFLGVPEGKLPPRGNSSSRSSKPPSRRAEPGVSAAYAAQAAEILLDAIARSDGTRSSVVRELLRTTVEDGILGDIRFDENGDLVEGPFTIFRVVGKRGRDSSGTAFQGRCRRSGDHARSDLLR